jgi:hypothetical protein
MASNQFYSVKAMMNGLQSPYTGQLDVRETAMIRLSNVIIEPFKHVNLSVPIATIAALTVSRISSLTFAIASFIDDDE